MNLTSATLWVKLVFKISQDPNKYLKFCSDGKKAEINILNSLDVQYFYLWDHTFTIAKTGKIPVHLN